MGRTYWDKRNGCRVELIPLCPKCKAPIYWTLISGVVGATGHAYCANSGTATRIIVDVREMYVCDWEGIVWRAEGGTVDIYDQEFRPVPHKVKQKRYL